MSEAELRQVVETTMKELSVPGVAVGVIHDGKEYTAGFGVTNVNHPQDVDADTLFQIGSISKTFLGTAVMRLVEQGKLTLDTPVSEYIPDFTMQDADAASRVTVRQLLNHTAGWTGDYFDDTGMGDDAIDKMVRQMAEIPQLTPLGQLFSYNNAGFYVAGRVIEIVTGQTFEAALKELVLDPLGMEMTFFFPDDVMVHRFAVGHSGQGDDIKVAQPWALARCANPAGGLASTVNDMLKYARVQLGEGPQILSAESIATMRTPSVPIDSFGNHVGVTWMLRNIGDVRIITHSGGTNGQISLFLTVPERNFAMVILTNNGSGGQLTQQVMKWALKHYLDAEDPKPALQERTYEQLQEYAGAYQAAMSKLELSVEDGRLKVQVTPMGGFPKKDSPAGPTPPPVRAGVIGKDQLITLDPPFADTRIDILRGPEGTIEWLRFGSRIARKQS
ncbi:MAG TPA: serine hydrolase domain-containing protein [Thermomicrobiales bacterium]|nr:serine hydrolase domain-containing protein [Thermomicrobiales bacterium]